MFKITIAFVSLYFGALIAGAVPPEVHVFVALADNASQGIVPVPQKIGDGNNPADNLYWGCADALPAVFGKSKDWKLVTTAKNVSADILDRRIFDESSGKLRLVADAYRGSAIQQATKDFFQALRSSRPVSEFPMAVYIGHDGLMDFQLPASATAGKGPGRGAIVLCCKSQDYFSPHLQAVRAKPILLTTQLMYPGAFILRSTLEGWIKNESVAALRERAAESYAANQKISIKAARGIFSSLDR